jgi:hypothetical protein
MKIKDALLNEILSNPTYFADIFLLMNGNGKIEVKASALEFQLRRKYKIAKQSLTITEYFRSKGFKDSEIFEN